MHNANTAFINTRQEAEVSNAAVSISRCHLNPASRLLFVSLYKFSLYHPELPLSLLSTPLSLLSVPTYLLTSCVQMAERSMLNGVLQSARSDAHAFTGCCERPAKAGIQVFCPMSLETLSSFSHFFSPFETISILASGC